MTEMDGMIRSSEGLYRLSDIIVDLSSRTVMRDGEVLDIRDLTFDLLAFLIARAPHPVTLEECAEQVWKKSHLSEETLTQRVAILRRALGDNAKNKKYIRTVRGVGYALACPSHPLQSPGPSSKFKYKRKMLAGGLIACALVALAGILTDPFGQNPRSTNLQENMSITDLKVDRARDLLKLHQASETTQAISLLEEALSLDPNAQNIRLMLSFAYSTRATKFKSRTSDIQDAENLARALLSEDVNFGAAWHALAYALDAQGRIDEAILAYQRSFRLNPNDAAAMSSAAYLMRIRGRFSDALDLEAQALKIQKPTLYAPVQIATTLSILDHEAASLWWERALASGSNQSVVLAEAMQEDLRKDTPQTALDRLKVTADDVSMSPRLLTLQGRAETRLGLHQDARNSFRMAGVHAELEAASLEKLVGNAVEVTDLIQEFEHIMLQGNSWPELRIRLAELYSVSGEVDEAINLISRAVDLGWRDIRYVETSPFLFSVLEHQQWPNLKFRIEREVSAQTDLLLTAEGSATNQMISAPL